VTLSRQQRRRHAALILEAALVYPVLVVLFMGLIVGGLGVWRYEQVACQAREAARWASVRGSLWAQETNGTSPTQKDIYQNAVAPLTAGMDASKIAIQVSWIDQFSGKVVAWDSAKKYPKSLNASNQYVTNSVRVTISYQWIPELFVVGPVILQSTSEIPMSF
jgi:hypothetical protein